jgi:hypothetical protein
MKSLWVEQLILDSQQEDGIFSSSLVSNGYGTNPSSHTIDAERREFFLEVKRTGSEAEQPPRVSVRVKNGWSHSSTTIYLFMSLYLMKYREMFPLTSHSIPNGSFYILAVLITLSHKDFKLIE